MPLFEYRCSSCRKEFELLLPRPQDATTCTQCGATGAARKFSVVARLRRADGDFGASAEEASANMSESPEGCGTCGDPRGPGACAYDD